MVLVLPGRFGLFGDGFRTISCESHEEKIEVGSVPSGPNVGVELFGRGGGVKVGKALPETGPLPHLFWASTYDCIVLYSLAKFTRC